jgi:hypothetical protein
MIFVKVKHFYIEIYSKLVGSRKKISFTGYFVTPAFVKTTFHCRYTVGNYKRDDRSDFKMTLSCCDNVTLLHQQQHWITLKTSAPVRMSVYWNVTQACSLARTSEAPNNMHHCEELSSCRQHASLIRRVPANIQIFNAITDGSSHHICSTLPILQQK